MKVMTILGVRPDIIKMWSTLKKLDSLNFDHVMVHTGQNFTPELKDFFFDDLELRQPDYYLDITTNNYAEEISDIIKKTDQVFEKVKPEALVILGDTFSGLSILPAKNRGIKTFHMEAGLRAWDKRMPEQRNRILIDHMSDILLPFNNYHRENLIRENIHPSKIIVTGNTTFEVMRSFQDKIDKSDILNKYKLHKNEFIILSAHRPENVDNPDSIDQILELGSALKEYFKKEIILPLHPRTKSKIRDLKKFESKFIITKPLGYLDFNKLIKNSFCILSDSGTSAEEGIFYNIPNVNLRMTTERMETLEGGSTIVSGLEHRHIIAAIETSDLLRNKPRYDMSVDHSPSSVVINALRTNITNFF